MQEGALVRYSFCPAIVILFEDVACLCNYARRNTLFYLPYKGFRRPDMLCFAVARGPTGTQALARMTTKRPRSERRFTGAMKRESSFQADSCAAGCL